MSKYYISECVECGFPCLHEACKYYHVKHYKCDHCNNSTEYTEIKHFENEDICEECYQKRVKKINEKIDDWYENLNKPINDILNKYAQYDGYNNIQDLCEDCHIDYIDLL